MSSAAAPFPVAIDATQGNMKKTSYGAVPTGPVVVVIEDSSMLNNGVAPHSLKRRHALLIAVFLVVSAISMFITSQMNERYALEGASASADSPAVERCTLTGDSLTVYAVLLVVVLPMLFCTCCCVPHAPIVSTGGCCCGGCCSGSCWLSFFNTMSSALSKGGCAACMNGIVLSLSSQLFAAITAGGITGNVISKVIVCTSS
mmetsp:Transcript_52869/g.146790  ORF Transcript_52869/g.146790 Transcript_52869/m.146790 type:complete len:202 (-) Transcript_52869:214-819(-)